MPEPITTFQVRIRGLLGTVHSLSTAEGTSGVLTMSRNARGTVTGARYAPSKGEVLLLRRDPGLLRSQFSLWTEGKEWLGSSLRWSFLRREIVLHTGSRPLRMVPVPGFRAGWSLIAPRTGEMARILVAPFARSARIEVYRKVDPELVVFAYFLAAQVRFESVWPGPTPEADLEPRPAAKAPKAPTAVGS
jgi:hypothetical protein